LANRRHSSISPPSVVEALPSVFVASFGRAEDADPALTVGCVDADAAALLALTVGCVDADAAALFVGVPGTVAAAPWWGSEM